MFCQKCGTQNPDNGKFCRACGSALGSSSFGFGNLMQPIEPMQPSALLGDDGGHLKSNDPDELWSGGIQSVISGAGFLVMAMVLLTTNVAGGRFWWWTMLFPAFPMLAKGISQLSKSKRIAKRNLAGNIGAQNQMPNFQAARNLPPPAPENLIYIERMINEGRKIEAVKVYRETFGSNLKEAKDAIEKIAAGQSAPGFQSPNEQPKSQKSIYDTGELIAPPSVVEGTTRHLEFNNEFNNEGETMTLPENGKWKTENEK